MNPIVTVLMCVYNAQEYLHESIPSILQQTFAVSETAALHPYITHCHAPYSVALLRISESCIPSLTTLI